jgi:hypothetical protein
MTSSQPAVTPNALNFTPDNKHCYFYSGDIATSGSSARLADFSTNSEYVYVKSLKMQLTDQTVSGVNYEFTVKFNGVTVLIEFLTNPYAGRQPADSDNFYLIIPPFTNVTIDFLASSGDKTACVTLAGEVYGMPDTDGYQ